MVFNSGCPTAFATKETLQYGLGLLNSKIVSHYVRAISPTINFQAGEINRVPWIESEKKDAINTIVAQNIEISRTDWDSFETSWDFQTHPLVALHPFSPKQIINEVNQGFHPTNTMKQTYGYWEHDCNERFNTLKANEEELNRIFIDIYGLQDELTPEVEDDHVTVSSAELARDVKSFISYAVGCMFGRYSLDEPGLAFAGGKFDMAKYKTFLPEDDNIIPIGSADYFDDDIVARFMEFVRVVYGDNTLGENLQFVADALYLNGSGTAQERIRRYFLNDFYKDHVRIYQKRPIYWLLDSGKKDGFKALFYLHRYDKYTIARARMDYLHPLQRKYEAEIKRLEMLSASTDNAREKAAYRKEVEVLLSRIDECRVYDQVVSHIAHQQIELDLDDGVKVNYAKFQGVEVPLDNGKTETMDLLAKI
jgi:hypothetical protein